MDTARDYYHAMRELVLRHPGGRSCEASLARLRQLCQAAEREAPDADCRARLAAIEAHAAILFSGCGSGNWVRRRILVELEEFRTRLYFLEVTEKAA